MKGLKGGVAFTVASRVTLWCSRSGRRAFNFIFSCSGTGGTLPGKQLAGTYQQSYRFDHALMITFSKGSHRLLRRFAGAFLYLHLLLLLLRRLLVLLGLFGPFLPFRNWRSFGRCAGTLGSGFLHHSIFWCLHGWDFGLHWGWGHRICCWSWQADFSVFCRSSPQQ